jgi:GNAT superfamily N-acetyltransferase
VSRPDGRPAATSVTTSPDAAPGRGRASSAGLTYRQATTADLDACTGIWKSAIDDYQGRLAQPPMPTDLGPLRRLLVHTLATDPDRFWVAEWGRGEVVGFSSATIREGLWFLAMLFVRPDLQGDGVGAALMDRAQAGAAIADGGGVPGPDDPLASGIHTWGMCTDAAQPISNALYARRGMLPRVPVWRLFGEVRRWAAVPELPASLEAVPFEAIVGGAGGGSDGHRRLAALVDGVDRDLIGAAHPADHAYLRREGRSGFLIRSRGDDAATPLGYVYGSAGGRLGPLAASDPALHPALLGVALRQTPMLDAVAMWVPGTADRATRALLDAGLRYDGFPGLACWSRPDHPFERYVPISLAIV